MKVQNAHTFTNAEENLIKDALLFHARFYEDENGSTAHLSYPLQKRHDELMNLYQSF